MKKSKKKNYPQPKVECKECSFWRKIGGCELLAKGITCITKTDKKFIKDVVLLLERIEIDNQKTYKPITIEDKKLDKNRIQY
jgi:hypothetical protein